MFHVEELHSSDEMMENSLFIFLKILSGCGGVSFPIERTPTHVPQWIRQVAACGSPLVEAKTSRDGI